MADLTQQDRDDYGKLIQAVKDLEKAIPDSVLLKSLIKPLSSLPANLGTPADLKEQLAKVDDYLVTQKFLLETLPNDQLRIPDANKPAIANATQKLSEQSALIKASLQDIDDADLSTLDDLDPPCTDEEFFKLIPQDKNVQGQTWTKNLLAGYPPNLNSNQIQQLTAAWGTAICDIVEDARKEGGNLEPGKPETIFRLFCIHEELEALYDRLSNLPNIVA